MTMKKHKAISLICVTLTIAMLAASAQAFASRLDVAGNCSVPEWCPITTLNQSGANSFYGTTAISNTDAWAVGAYNDSITGGSLLAEHWNGSAWTTVTPASVTGNARFVSASATASNDVWAVGWDNYPNIFVQLTLAQHWNGSSWTVVSTPNGDSNAGNILAGVAAISTNDVWAAGDYNRSNSPNIDYTLIEHWNGTTWSQAASPNINPGNDFNALTGITAISTNDVWTVGYYESPSIRPLIEHWNGTSWTIPASLPDPGIDSVLNAVAAYSANDVWAVGEINPNGTPQPLIVHWDGTSWSIATLPSGNGGQLWGVTVTPHHDVWAVGNTLAGTPLVMHWQGGSINSWVQFPAAYPMMYGSLHAVAAPLSETVGNITQMWAVGNSSDGSNSYTLADTYAPLVQPGLMHRARP